MNKAEMIELAKRYETNTQLIQALLDGGVSERDLDHVLELRDEATIHFNIRGTYKDTAWVELPSSKVLTQLYGMVEGDLDLMEIAVTRAIHEANRRRFPRHGTCDACFKRVMGHGIHWLLYGEMEEDDDDEGFGRLI